MSAYSDFLDEAYALPNSVKLEYNEDLEIIRDQWIEKRKYKELISFIIENWDSGNCVNFIIPLTERLAKEREIRLHRRIWGHVFRHNLILTYTRFETLKEKFPEIMWKNLESLDMSEFSPHSSTDLLDIKKSTYYSANYTLNALKIYRNQVVTFTDEEELNDIDRYITDIHQLKVEFPESKEPEIKETRKINETIFWELIEQSRKETEDKLEFIDLLTHKLSAFKPTEIKRFQKLLLTFYNQLNHWDNWALAYIIRRGCGNDAFDYFRLWVVSKGKTAFEAIRDFDISKFEKIFNLEDPQLEELMYVAENIYEENTGEYMKELRVKNQKIKGKSFEEEKICFQYPELCQLFDFKEP